MDAYVSGNWLDTRPLALAVAKQGIADVFEASQKQTWILTERRELRDWLRLLPFTNRPADAFDIVRALPEQHRTPDALAGC